MAGNGLAVDALGLFAKEFNEGGPIAHFAFGFGQGFALFGC